MSSPVGSSLRLPPDATAAGAARRFVAAALPGPEREDLRDVATLLVSELVTNAVVHAASAVDLDLDLGEDEVTVRVRDADTGPLVLRAGAVSELDEGGRGFLLVDRLADAWGTEHHGGRKTVWFRVTAATAAGVQAPNPLTPRHAPAAGPAGDAPEWSPRLRRLLLAPPTASALTFEEHVGELLMRVIETVGAIGAAVTLSHDEAAGVRRGDVTAGTVAKCDLIVEDRALGTLSVHGSKPLDDDAHAFVTLAADRIALLVAEHGLFDTDRARAAELDFLAEATELLTRSLSVSLTLALVAQIVVPRLGEWCAAFAVDERGRPRRLTVNHRQEDRTDAVAALLDTDTELRATIRQVAEGAAPQRLPTSALVAGQRSYVTVLPLQSRGRTLGVLVIGRLEPLDPMTYMAALELGRRAALAVDNARLHEEQASTVHALQASLLPSDLPQVPNLRLAARYHSASAGIAVGGDFYDAYVLPDGRLALAIGDVCGKGAEAAAVTGMTRDLLRVLLQDGADVVSALHRLNRALIDHPTATRFCTVALATVTEHADGMTVRLCLAGHPEPVLLRPSGDAELVGTPGDLLGILADDDLGLVGVEVTMRPGESLVFYTDGVTERRDERRMFGQYGVRHTLRSVATADAQVIADTLEEAARSFVATELRDDLAILVAKCLG